MKMYDNIKAEMAKHNLTFKDFAKIIEVKPATVASRLVGMSEFKVPEFVKMADYFDCSLDYLAERKGKWQK